MAFTLETGAGVAGANAFVDPAYVTAYLTDRNRLTEGGWSGLSAPVQEAACIAATDYIEKVFAHRYLGRRKLAEQGLGWPRINVVDRDGFWLDSDALPVVLQQATAEYAVRAAASALLPDPVVDPSGRTVVGSKDVVGPIETERKFEEGGALSMVVKPYPAADKLIAPLLTGGGRVVRG